MRSRVPTALLCCATALACLASAGCTRDGAIHASGRVIDDRIVVQAPALAVPPADPDAGFPLSPAPGSVAMTPVRSRMPTLNAITGLGSVSRVTTVGVALGETVEAGDVIAEFDPAALEADVVAARADEAVLRAQIGVLGQALDTVDESESKLSKNRRTLRDTLTRLTSTRADLAARLAQLEAVLSQLQASKASSDTTPPQLPPGTPTPDQARAMIAQLEGAITQIDAGLAKARQGRSQLDSAASKLADARTQLGDMRRLAVIAADASAIGVRAAEYQRSLAVVRAPTDGIIARVAHVGDVLAPGATVAEIREPVAARIRTWLAAADLRRIAEGDPARVSADWLASGPPLAGHVTDIGQRADYPPTSFATKDVHLTRAVPVEITVQGVGGAGAVSRNAPPPGAPVDVTILPRTKQQP